VHGFVHETVRDPPRRGRQAEVSETGHDPSGEVSATSTGVSRLAKRPRSGIGLDSPGTARTIGHGQDNQALRGRHNPATNPEPRTASNPLPRWQADPAHRTRSVRAPEAARQGLNRAS
jgi:hypothetical protein